MICLLNKDNEIEVHCFRLLNSEIGNDHYALSLQ